MLETPGSPRRRAARQILTGGVPVGRAVSASSDEGDPYSRAEATGSRLACFQAVTRSAGYALIETLVAAAIVVAVAAGVAHVAVLTGAAVQASGAQGRALFLAVQKLEQLQSLVWTFDADLQTVSDESTSLAFDPPAPGGRGLQASGPVTGPGADGYVDYLDRDGRWIGTGSRLPAGTAFVRRWSVTPLAVAGSDALLLQVMVVATGLRGPSATLDLRPNDPGVTWLATARVRR